MTPRCCPHMTEELDNPDIRTRLLLELENGTLILPGHKAGVRHIVKACPWCGTNVEPKLAKVIDITHLRSFVPEQRGSLVPGEVTLSPVN